MLQLLGYQLTKNTDFISTYYVIFLQAQYQPKGRVSATADSAHTIMAWGR